MQSVAHAAKSNTGYKPHRQSQYNLYQKGGFLYSFAVSAPWTPGSRAEAGAQELCGGAVCGCALNSCTEA
eukprot:3104492-Rhodomonas_salina.3